MRIAVILIISISSVLGQQRQNVQPAVQTAHYVNPQTSASVQHVAQKRDGGHHVSQGHAVSHSSSSFGGGDSYSAPVAPQSYAAEPQGYGENKHAGMYYYYYPVMKEGGGKKGGLFSGSKGFFGRIMETMLYPLTYPISAMRTYFNGRALQSRADEYLPMGIFDKVAEMIKEEVYKEECLSRIICKLGKSAEGYETFLDLSEFFVPEDYQTHLMTFKDSALRKSNCEIDYKCKSLDLPKIL